MKHLIIMICLLGSLFSNEKVFVVERQNESLAVIKNFMLNDNIPELHNMNHATVKFAENDGYVISRDGWIVKFNLITNKKLAEYKTSQSAIGFVVEPKYVAVANYDNKTVEILDRDLRHLQTIKTDSKNVGIKVYKNILVFALMDKDELWVCDNTADKDSTPKFETIKKFTSVGEVPFDAMIRDNLYIVGFFNSPWIGVVNLDNMSYKKISFTKEESQPVLKVPHFGFWSIGDTNIFVPSVGEASVMAFDTNFKFVKKIKTQGLPVFTSLSPDKKLLAVTFSGKEFPIVQIIDVNTLKIVQTIDFGGTVLHVRWSEDSPLLYVSVNTKNELQLIDTTTWQKKAEIPVRQPSGIFLYHTPDTRDMK